MFAAGDPRSIFGAAGSGLNVETRVRDETAPHYAAACLLDLGFSSAIHRLPWEGEHPAIAWARAGMLGLCGRERALMCPAPLAGAADGALMALQALADVDFGFSGSVCLGERARLMGLSRQGRTAPGGACFLVGARDGYLALNLPRDEDLAALAAWLQDETITDLNSVLPVIHGFSCAELEDRGRLLGLAVAREPARAMVGQGWFERQAIGELVSARRDRLRVIDLSSLWAGPMAGQMLRLCGAEVIKVESAGRLDGARRGNAEFFDRLNGGKSSVVLDFSDALDLVRLRELILSADMVIESARPRGLRQLGIVAEEILAARPGMSWVAISGYGRDEESENAVAFGDDAGVAAGLTRMMRIAYGQTVFVGDAIGDPLTGLHAALAGYASWMRGGGELVSLALRDVVAHAIGDAGYLPGAELRARARRWGKMAAAATDLERLPVGARAVAAGADTDQVMRHVDC